MSESSPAPQIDAGWTQEKAGNIVSKLCFLLEHLKSIESTLPEDRHNPRDDFYALLYDATKIYCAAVSAMRSDPATRWSPDLPQYLFDHPEKCEEMLRIVSSEDFEDQYYQK